jgi:hypothetical protein
MDDAPNAAAEEATRPASPQQAASSGEPARDESRAVVRDGPLRSTLSALAQAYREANLRTGGNWR